MKRKWWTMVLLTLAFSRLGRRRVISDYVHPRNSSRDLP